MKSRVLECKDGISDIDGSHIRILRQSCCKSRVALYSCKLLQLHIYLCVQRYHGSLLNRKGKYISCSFECEIKQYSKLGKEVNFV